MLIFKGDTKVNDYKHQRIDGEIKDEDSAVVKMNKLIVKDVKQANDLDRLDLPLSLTVPDATYLFSQLDEAKGVNASIMVS